MTVEDDESLAALLNMWPLLTDEDDGAADVDDEADDNDDEEDDDDDDDDADVGEEDDGEDIRLSDFKLAKFGGTSHLSE